jgi:hypothetical protein
VRTARGPDIIVVAGAVKVNPVGEMLNGIDFPLINNLTVPTEPKKAE